VVKVVELETLPASISPQNNLTQTGHLMMNNQSVFNTALLAEQKGEYQQALQMFQTCLAEDEYDPGEVLFHCGWCSEHVSNGDNTRALRYYELAAVDTINSECRLNSFFRAGWLLMHQKEHAKAATMFRYAIDYAELSHHKNETYNQSAFWYAVCLESQEWYIEAIRWYRLVRLVSPHLDPESRLRELSCLNRIGSFHEALGLCCTFDSPPPIGFDERRYRELQAVVYGEKAMLERCVADRPFLTNAKVHYGTC
jgi:tetratricopeptide (TPR) repeat protein